MEIVLLMLVLLAAVIIFLRDERNRRYYHVRTIVVGVLVLAGWRGTVWYFSSYGHHLVATHIAQHVPAQSTDNGYVSSATCKTCHVEHYHSWHRTYHRSMTQAASPRAVLGDFDNVELTRILRRAENETHLVEKYRLEQRGETFLAKLLSTNNPAATRFTGRLGDGEWHQIVMTTGSHHYQMYWTSPDPDRMQFIFPFAYLLDDRRWVQRESALLTPPRDAHQSAVRWNAVCIRCHSTHSQPRVSFDAQGPTAQTRVAELGISCEACHGPGEAHVRANQSPLRRYQQENSGLPDPTIINPKRLSAQRASQICGHCHAIAAFSSKDWEAGHWNRYQTGGDLVQTRTIIRPNRPETLTIYETLGLNDEQIAREVDDRYWSDGMVRVSGREFNGMTESPCYTHGIADKQVSCLSCHSMHDSDPNDQLAQEMGSDRACLQCHETYAKNIEQHTHHTAKSSGSRCYNCHMPHTTYGLLKAIRSHQIDSPTVSSTLKTGRPNACNACHLDKTLKWTQDHLADWHDTPPVKLSADEQAISATLLAALRGDAGQRALAAWAMGWETAKRPSGDSWLAPYLAEMLDDDYTAVRYIAARSLRRLPEYKNFQFDFVGPPGHRAEARNRALKIWQSSGPARAKGAGPRLLIDANGKLDRQTIDRLMRDPNRDKRVDLKE